MKKRTRYTIRKPKDYRMIIFLVVICIFLILLILYTQGKIQSLEDFIARGSVATQESENAEEKQAPQAMPYSSELRIVLKDRDQDIYRGKVTVYGDGDLTITKEGQTQTIAPQTQTVVTAEQCQNGNVMTISCNPGNQWYLVNEDGVTSIGYEGTLEIWGEQQGLVLVNDIPMEYYLKRVVPSEMPRTYGAEALKAQAICARTYAYGHSNRYAYPEVKGNMDDTVSFQVYNQGMESAETNEAILATTGQILMKDDAVIDTLYYSTSCGYMQDGTLFGDMDTSVFQAGYLGIQQATQDFDTYLRSPDEQAYEAGERYFRWQASLTANDFSKVRAHLCNYLQTDDTVSCDKKLKKKIMDANVADADVFGSLKNITVKKRNPGGVAMTIVLAFSGGDITVNDQLHIRQILGDFTDYVVLQNQETIKNTTTLPSAAITIEKQKDGQFLIYGGGFGHGVGMSQNGAKALAASGFAYTDILQYFYHGTAIQKLY